MKHWMHLSMAMLALLFSGACGGPPQHAADAVAVPAVAGTPAPPYTGPIPSARAQAALHELRGKLLVLESGPLAGTWNVGAFDVSTEAEGGTAPAVRLERDGHVRYLPVITAGDVADLYQRVIGVATPLVRQGELSESYRRAGGRS